MGFQFQAFHSDPLPPPPPDCEDFEDAAPPLDFEDADLESS